MFQPSHKDFRDAALAQNTWHGDADFWLKPEGKDRAEYSRAASAIYQRPVWVVDPARLSFAPPSPPKKPLIFNLVQTLKRAGQLRQMANAEMPEHAAVWKLWGFRDLASHYEPAISYDNTKVLPRKLRRSDMPQRLRGRYWKEAAIIFSSDSRWTIKEEWQRLLGIDPLLIENHPQGRGIKYYLVKHEFGHLPQLRPRKINYVPDISLAERDADLDAFKALRNAANEPGRDTCEAEDLLETIKAVKHARALKGFINADPIYWLALSLDDHKSDEKEGILSPPVTFPTYNMSWYSGFELRLRVYERMQSRMERRSSEDIQREINDWWTNPFQHRMSLDREEELRSVLFNGEPVWAKFDIRRTLPILKDIMAKGEITNPVTLRNAELIIEAAEYFCPSVFVDRSQTLDVRTAVKTNAPPRELVYA